MAFETPRILWDNAAVAAATSISPSSAQESFPVRYLRENLRTMGWRSRLGWSIVRGFNATLCFSEGGVERVAFIAPTTYPTGTLVAAAVQDAMDAAGISPLELTPTLWLRGESLCSTLITGDAVATWPDSSGNGYDMAQGTAENQPTFYRSAINARPAVSFDGGDSLAAAQDLVDDLLGTHGAGTIFVVCRPSDITSDAGILTTATLETGAKVSGGYYVASATDGTVREASLAAVLGSWFIATWTHDPDVGGNVSAGYADSDDAALDATACSTSTDTGSAATLGSGFSGQIAEVLVFASVLTEEQRRRVVAYLAQKYGVSDSTTAPTWVNTYAVAHSEDSIFSIAVADGSDSLSLLWSTGLCVETSIGHDLGYDVSADDTGGASYVADFAAYQSRHYLAIDLGAATDVSVCAVVGHNALGTGGTVTIQAADVPDWSSPDVSQSLAANTDDTLRLKFFAEATHRYWRYLVDDVRNSSGYAHVGYLFLGTYFEPARGLQVGLQDARIDRSGVQIGDAGGYFQSKALTVEKRWQLVWGRIPNSDRDVFDEMIATIGIGRAHFLCRDPLNNPATSTRFGVAMDLQPWPHSVGDGDPPERWSIAYTFCEQTQ